jgi:hypothetical protein
MVICPVANTVGCNKCGVVNFCLLRSIVGNYGEEQPGEGSEESKSTESKPPD